MYLGKTRFSYFDVLLLYTIIYKKFSHPDDIYTEGKLVLVTFRYILPYYTLPFPQCLIGKLVRFKLKQSKLE